MLLRDKSYWNLGSSKIKTFIFLVILAVVVYVDLYLWYNLL